MQTKKSIAELSADTAVMIAEFSKIDRGTDVTYETISNWLGRKIDGSHDLSGISTVKNRLRADYQKVLSPIPGKGYRILTHNEALHNQDQISRARRAAAKRKKELSTVELSTLSEPDKLEWAAKVTQSHLIVEASREKTLAKLSNACNGACEPLALAKALDAIKGNV